MGYATIYTGFTKSYPYRVEIWLKNKIVRADDFQDQKTAERWAGKRKRRCYGSMTPAQARKMYQ